MTDLCDARSSHCSDACVPALGLSIATRMMLAAAIGIWHLPSHLCYVSPCHDSPTALSVVAPGVCWSTRLACDDGSFESLRRRVARLEAPVERQRGSLRMAAAGSFPECVVGDCTRRGIRYHEENPYGRTYMCDKHARDGDADCYWAQDVRETGTQ